ncbi:MAG: hypothetical protein HY556_05670 [Euryarchaeota archaeon]|nr:hypothetical protein [Euryarchaeota archaeon]
MPNMTLSVDEETAKEVRRHPEVRWSEVARQAFRRKLRELHALDTAFANSELDREDVERLARKANLGLLKKLAKR